ncbi:helix-turn-helix domain-containing protein [Variovorax terrae]|uniref:Helix-turn-helix domain-containing protein n=1 Tax=Variovorax terrae TaxID=2923278 RepID=A0A9X1W4D7_9BURK|nr:helix-turn-helix domain-containing protein [Variovorax terrae]MCJ0765623.1 helix-turn-helix domain-containing protein [Variovorax terrae]
MADLNVVSTQTVAPRDRLHLWGDAVWRLIGGLQSDAFGDEAFNGRIVSGQAGCLSLCQLDVSRHRVVRTPSLIRGSDRAFLKVVAQLKGRACFEQNGRHVWLSPGEWSVYDTTQSYSVANPDSVQQMVLMIPKEQMPERGLRLDHLMVQRFSGSSGVSRLAWSTLLSAFDELPGMAAPVAEGVADTLTQLVHLSLLERNGSGTALTQREALKDRIRHYIGRHLGDPGLSIDRIAQALNCSRRHLYNAFGGEHETLAAYIQRERLENCARDLRRPALAARSITEIALSWGFNNTAHFSRAFRAHTGFSPSAFRQRPAHAAPALLSIN